MVFSNKPKTKGNIFNLWVGFFCPPLPVTTSGICWWAWLMAPAIFSTHCSVVMVPSEEPGWKLYSFRPSMWQRPSSSTSSSWLFANTSRSTARTQDQTVERDEHETRRNIRPTLFRRSTVHQVGAMGHDVSGIKSVRGTLNAELFCSRWIQSWSLPGTLGAQKQGEARSSHL